MKKYSVIVVLLLIAIIAACGSKAGNTSESDNVSTPQANHEETVKPPIEEPPIKIEEIDVIYDVVNNEPVFGATNYSSYKIGGPKIIRVENDTGDFLVADAYQICEYGETSDVAVFWKDAYDEDGNFLGAIPTTPEEIENSYPIINRVFILRRRGQYLLDDLRLYRR